MPEPVPNKVVRATPFVLDNPTRPANPAKLDAELNAVVGSLNNTIDFVRQVITDDGRLTEEATGASEATLAYINARTPQITVGPTPPTAPAIGDVWIDTN